MSKQDYLEQGNPAFSAQMLTFKNAIPAYANILGLTSDQLAAQAADANYYANVLAIESVFYRAERQWSAWKKLLRSGGATADTGMPEAPVIPPAVPPVPPGVEGRFRALVQLVKASPAYNAPMGQALGTEGSEKTGPDLNTITPVITAILTGGHIHIDWGWQSHGSVLSMIEIQVNHGNGYVLLTYDTTPGYTDTTPLPATPTKWTYKAIYRVGDHQVGHWSQEVEINVGG